MTYIGSVKDSGGSMSDEQDDASLTFDEHVRNYWRRQRETAPTWASIDSPKPMSDERRMEQERIQGFCPSMPSDNQAAWDCAEAFRGLADGMGAIGAAMNNSAAQNVQSMAADAFSLAATVVPTHDMANQINAAMNAAQSYADMDQRAVQLLTSGAPLPYLIVPRQERTEVEMLREKLAAMEALIASLTPAPAAPVPDTMARAIGLWPGSQGFIQGIRWRGGR